MDVYRKYTSVVFAAQVEKVSEKTLAVASID